MQRFAVSRRAALVGLGVLAAAVLALLLVPTGDPSYRCGRPPVAYLVSPAAESALLRQDFFDEGYQCNRDARGRGVASLVVLTIGAAAALTLRRLPGTIGSRTVRV